MSAARDFTSKGKTWELPRCKNDDEGVTLIEALANSENEFIPCFAT